MSDPFVAEIRIFPFNFAPRGWAFCNGQLLPISQNTALFSLLGTNFGGDGKSNFGLPNLQGSVPQFYEQGPGLSPYVIGQTGGTPSVALLQTQLAPHTHAVNALGTPPPANTGTPAAGVALARSSGGAAYAQANDLAAMSPSIVTQAGGGQAHNNLMPYLVLNFCIALQGIFPARN